MLICFEHPQFQNLIIQYFISSAFYTEAVGGTGMYVIT